jgi:hypothetical protein
MKSEQLKDDFYPLMKVLLGDDYGVVTDEYWRISDTYSGQAANADLPHYGVIRWDTNKEADYEDWRGLWGTFTAMGGRQIEQDHQFKFIDDDGTFKSSVEGDFRVG